MKLTPYRKVAKAALMNWYGKSAEEATEIIESQPYEEVESGDGSPKFGMNEWWGVGAEGSIIVAIDKIAEILHLSDEQKERFAKCVFAKDHTELDEYDKLVFADIQKKWAKEVESNPKAIIEVLEVVHDNWVKTNAKKFNQEGRENKRYQHLPIEMIGWKETKADLLFVASTLEAVGVEVNEEVLEAFYNKRVERFFAENDLTGQEELEGYILNIADHYAPISDKNNPKNTEKPEETATAMADQVIDRLPVPVKEKVETEDK